jgi:hypothetical protein
MMDAMTVRHPIEAAEQIFRSLGGFPAGDREAPPPVRLFAAVKAFAAVQFDVARHLAEQDGFFFQFAAVTTFGDDIGFVLSIVRQFARVDADDEHLGFSQLQAEYRFAHDPELDAQGHHEDFWFPSWPEPFEDWFARITAHPAWRFVGTKRLTGFEIWQEWV